MEKKACFPVDRFPYDAVYHLARYNRRLLDQVDIDECYLKALQRGVCESRGLRVTVEGGGERVCLELVGESRGAGWLRPP